MKIRLATPTDADRITEMRLEAYTQVTNGKITDMDTLRWNDTDQNNVVLYIEDDSGQVVTSARYLRIDSKSELEEHYDIRTGQALDYPILTIDRLSTLTSQRGKRLSASLRQLAVQICQLNEVNYLAVTVNEGVSRIPALSGMGFDTEFPDTSHRSGSMFDNSARVVLAWLPKSRYESALEVNGSILKLQLSDFEIEEAIFERFSAYLSGS